MNKLSRLVLSLISQNGNPHYIPPEQNAIECAGLSYTAFHRITHAVTLVYTLKGFAC